MLAHQLTAPLACMGIPIMSRASWIDSNSREMRRDDWHLTDQAKVLVAVRSKSWLEISNVVAAHHSSTAERQHTFVCSNSRSVQFRDRHHALW